MKSGRKQASAGTGCGKMQALKNSKREAVDRLL